MLNNDPIDGMDIDHDDKDMLTWKITITGLDDTPYAACLPQVQLHVTLELWKQSLPSDGRYDKTSPLIYLM